MERVTDNSNLYKYLPKRTNQATKLRIGSPDTGNVFAYNLIFTYFLSASCSCPSKENIVFGKKSVVSSQWSKETILIIDTRGQSNGVKIQGIGVKTKRRHVIKDKKCSSLK